MATLNSQYITIDAVLTRKGRECYAKNDGSFQITQFALSDDEIDYSLYNPSHPSGSAFYGEAIENISLLEAFPDETQIMKYKLVTLPRGTSKLPVISLGYTSITLKQGASLNISPQTLNYLGNTSVLEANGYVMTVSDVRLLSTFNGIGINSNTISSNDVISGSKFSKSQLGTSFTLGGTTINTLFGSGVNSLTTNITVIGRDSGARITIPLILIKNNN